MSNYMVTIVFYNESGEMDLEQVTINAPDTTYARNNAWLSVLDEYGYGCKQVEVTTRRMR